MNKSGQVTDYKNEVTENCEQVLVTLLRGLGPWKNSIYLVGGLTPRYLIKGTPPRVPLHAGTSDVDIVVKLLLLADTQAYHSLEKNFKRLGLEHGENANGEKVSWRWQMNIKDSAKVILELLADIPEFDGGRVCPIPTEGNISVLNVPHSSMVFDHHGAQEVRAELLGGDGVAIETVRYADIVSFICLKSYALDQRHKYKDAYDLVYCLKYFEGGPQAVAAAFRSALEGKHKDAIESALIILEKRFADDKTTEGYVKDGPVAVAKFQLGEDTETRDERILRQRQAADLIMTLLQEIRA